MKIILFFQSTTRKSWRQKLDGIHRYALEHDWFVQLVERFATASDVRRALENWSPAGCLVDRAMSNGRAPDSVFRGFPTVYLDQNPKMPSSEHPCLLHDSAATAALAVQELLALGCRSYAYLGTEKGFNWDAPRLDRFKTDAKRAGHSVAVLHRKSLVAALRSLPKPCGILGANDYSAMEAYHAATKAGLSIPDDIAIAGIDNDETLCEMVSPGLTSVEPDFEGAGWRLGEMLTEEIARIGTSRPASPFPKIEYYGPLRIVRRGSTSADRGQSLPVRHALEYVRRHGCERGISIDAVAAAMGCSRSLATSRFRKETGRTILDEVHDVRFRNMCDLLSRSSLPVAMVVEKCGYESDGFAKKMFLARTGMTMREYRKCACNPISGGTTASDSRCSP